MSEKLYLSNSGLQRVWTKIKSLLNGKVDKVSGKGLSTNDYTTAEKNKLSGIATGAEVNVQSDWEQTTTTAKDYIKNKPNISSLLDGKVDKVSGKGLSTNDYTAAEKTKLSGIETGANKTTVDSALSSTSINPVQNKVINAALGDKVDKVSGKRLSTNDYTTAEKNKLASIEQGAKVNVQPDWSQTDTGSDDYIKNKPTIPSAQIQSDWNQNDSTAKDYIKNKPSVPSGQVQSDWNQATTTEPDYIKNKPDISTLLNGKVDKESGKGLSSNDYTLSDKSMLTALAGQHVYFTYNPPDMVVSSKTFAQLSNVSNPIAHMAMYGPTGTYLYSECVYWKKITGSNPGFLFCFEAKTDSTNVLAGLTTVGFILNANGVSVRQMTSRYDAEVLAALCTPMLEWTEAQRAAARQTLGVDTSDFLPSTNPTVTGDLTINYTGDNIPVGETLSGLNGCYEYDGPPTESNRMDAINMLIGYKGNCTVRYTATSGHAEYSYFMTNFTGVNDTITFMEVSPAGEIVIWVVDGNTYVITKVRTI